ncbi:MAG: hypothetical protein ACW98F_01730, partial [Candidatus Hodarchaeales archaeon]
MFAMFSMATTKAVPFEDLSQPKFLFVTNNNADHEIALAVNQTMNLNATIVDIKTSENLNQLFLTGNYFETYDSIILILNQITNPLDASLTTDLNDFVSQGKMFGIISTQIWRFNSSFHSLMGLEITTQGQKEYPMGNSSDSIEISITNDTLLTDPFQYTENTSLLLDGGVGLAQSTTLAYQVARSSNPPYGDTSLNAFEYKTGFIIALPLSPIDISPSLSSLSQFVTSLTNSGLEVLERNQILNQNSETTASPDRILFLFSNKDLEIGIAFSALSILFVGL